MKKAYLTGLMMSICAAVVSAAPTSYKSMVVKLTDETSVQINLSDDLLTEFTATDMRIHDGNGTDMKFPKSKIAACTFSELSSAAVINAGGDISPEHTPDGVKFSNLKHGTVIDLLAADGRHILRGVESDGEYQIRFSSLQAGIYIITVNGVSYKITVGK